MIYYCQGGEEKGGEGLEGTSEAVSGAGQFVFNTGDFAAWLEF